MNQSTVVEVLEQLLAQEKTKLGPIVTPPGPAARVPIQVDNVVPPAWSPAIAAMRQQDYLAVFAGGVRPTPLPLSASQASATSPRFPSSILARTMVATRRRCARPPAVILLPGKARTPGFRQP